jgi:hypothetical protein
MNKLRLLRELTLNMCDTPNFEPLPGEEDPIHGLFPILDEVTRAYNETMLAIKNFAKDI